MSDAGVRAILEQCVHLQELCVAGVKKLTSAPFLPIISDLTQWRRSQALLQLKLQEAKVLDEDEHYSSDEVRGKKTTRVDVQNLFGYSTSLCIY